MLENKLNINSEVELAKEEERITKLKALELFDTNKINNLHLAQTLGEGSILQSSMTFDESGIEMKKSFKIIVSTKRNINEFVSAHKCVVGSITRNDDFYTATYKMHLVGEDFSTLISKEDIKDVNSTPEITVPIKTMYSLENDINLLYVLDRSLKDLPIGGPSHTGILPALLYDYYRHYDYANDDPERYEEDYERCRKIIKYNEKWKYCRINWLVSTSSDKYYKYWCLSIFS